jgi:hypothetical protein
MDKVVVDESGCWIYTGSRNPYGYGYTLIGSRLDGSRRRAMTHRLVYEDTVGPIPAGLDLDHLCRVRACCNPDHLEPVTRQVNLLRGETIPAANAAKTECRKGHEYVGANVGRDKQTGARICRACRAEQQRERRARRTA